MELGSHIAESGRDCKSRPASDLSIYRYGGSIFKALKVIAFRR